MSNRTACRFAALAIVAGFPSLTHAAVANGDFETGTLAGWTIMGSAHNETAGFGIAPAAGTFDGYIETTGNGTAPASVILPAMGITGPTIMGLAIGAAPTNGTAIYQSITVNAGDALSFDWNFMTDELNEDPVYNDYAFFSLDNSATLISSRHTGPFDPFLTPPLGFDGQTGWYTATHTFTAAGTVQLGFLVFNVIDGGHNSVLLLDNISVVPEPGVVGMLGVIGLGVMRRRAKRRAA